MNVTFEGTSLSKERHFQTVTPSLILLTGFGISVDIPVNGFKIKD